MIATSSLTARLLPRSDRPSRRSARVVERNIAVARQIWLIIVSGFFEPVFYLFSIGIGLGHLVGNVPYGGTTVPYRDFVAPAMLASSAMNGAIFACTFNIFFRLKYQKTYDAIVATPVGVGDIVTGEIGWALIRGVFYSACFFGVMLALGLLHSAWSVLAVPTAVLIGYAFAGLGMAGTSFMRTWKDFDFVTLAIIPLFLFSGTFSPLAAYPATIRWIVRATPLYQGVVIERGLVLGHVNAALLGHALYLAVVGTAGVVVASRRIGRLLLR
ncbi:MAG TPA: ABC transporter permease [Acidimicrobiales bacterium]|nr:ABC transporter permease [Acidimicrobiales bacterium]